MKSHFGNLSDCVTPVPFVWYRRAFGIVILFELLFMTDSIIHVVYENWEPCFVPVFREWNLPVTHFAIDTALYLGLFLSVMFVCDEILSARLNVAVRVSLCLTYTYLRVIHFYNWNNHYYLNMLFLILFVLTSSPIVPRWFYSVFQLLLGTVYFFAGVSKLSTAWLDGVVAETMTHNHDLVLPLICLSWGGFLLDLFGGLVVIFNAFFPVPLWLFYGTHLSFIMFHLHNLLYMFKSIQFFPLNMLFSILLFVPNVHSGTTKPIKVNRKIACTLAFGLVFGQAIFACRRFFILVDYPWQVWAANDIAEFHSLVHHFSWRMKSRSVSSHVFVGGKWPTMMAIGVTRDNDTGYLAHTDVYSSKIYGDAEFGIQPLVRRVARQMSDADPAEVQVNLYWWTEINQGPFQLLVNPELNFVGATQIPFWGPPPLTHVEAQLVPREGWISLLRDTVRRFDPEFTMNWIPYIMRNGVRVPNPFIAHTKNLQFMPQFLLCLYGSVVLETRDRGFLNVTDNLAVLPSDGDFHLFFPIHKHSDEGTMFLLGFPI